MRIEPHLLREAARCFHPSSARIRQSQSDATANNRPMNIGTSTAAENVSDIATALAKWYGARASIRRMWAIDRSAALEVLVALEPTPDGGETLPIWLANKRHWTYELQQLAQRDVQLKLVALDDFGEFYPDPEAALIAELHWRVSW